MEEEQTLPTPDSTPPAPQATLVASRPSPTGASDAPPERLVRHVFWKYPIISVVMLIVVALLAALVGSPNYPRDTIAAVTKDNPGGAVLAFTQELDGTASSSGNAVEFGMKDPGQLFVLGPLHAAVPLLGQVSLPNLPQLSASDVQQAVSTFEAAGSDQQVKWASTYKQALDTITPKGEGDMDEEAPSPDYTKISTLKGDFGPCPH